MARAHSVIVDRRLRSRQYVDRNTKKPKSAKAREGPVLEHVGQLIPDVRDRVDAALKTSSASPSRMRRSAVAVCHSGILFSKSYIALHWPVSTFHSSGLRDAIDVVACLETSLASHIAAPADTAISWQRSAAAAMEFLWLSNGLHTSEHNPCKGLLHGVSWGFSCRGTLCTRAACHALCSHR